MNRKYFSRAATWHLLNDRIVIHDSFGPLAPRMITMEPWYEVAFMAADGVHTVGQFVESIGRDYEGGPPPGLEAQIHGIVETLLSEHVLRIHDEPKALPEYFGEDYFSKSPEIRAEQMRRDGLIPKELPRR